MNKIRKLLRDMLWFEYVLLFRQNKRCYVHRDKTKKLSTLIQLGL